VNQLTTGRTAWKEHLKGIFQMVPKPKENAVNADLIILFMKKVA